jgi:NADH dehydrogenase FAD-containing subunit
LAEKYTRDSGARESERVYGRMIKEFWVKSRGRLVSSGSGSDAVTVVFLTVVGLLIVWGRLVGITVLTVRAMSRYVVVVFGYVSFAFNFSFSR